MVDKRMIMAPFHYRVDGLLKGKKRSDAYHVLDTVPVEIDVLTDEEAPIVLETLQRDYRRHRGVEIVPMSADKMAANYQEKLTGSQIAKVDGMVGLLALFVEDFGMNGDAEWRPLINGMMRFFGHEMSKARSSELYEFSRISSTNEDEARAAAVEAWSSNLVIVGDQVWLRAREPVFKVIDTATASNEGYVVVSVSPSADYGRQLDATFRMDRLDDATAYARRLAGDRKVVVFEHRLADATGWRFDDTGHDAVAVFRDFQDRLSMRSNLLFTTVEFFVAATNVRDMKSHAASPEELYEAMMALRDAGAGVAMGKGRTLVDWVGASLEDIEWRWRQAGRDARHQAETEDMAAIAGMGR